MLRRRHLISGFGCVMLALGTTMAAAADVPVAVASIKPIHSLLAGVMEGVGWPALLVRGGASPHGWSLRPSDARALDDAELIVWVGDELESFLARPLHALASDARVLELSRGQGIDLLRAREGGVWDAHEDDHETGHGEEHEEDEDARAFGHDDGHRRGTFNMHLWLDPGNAAAMVEAMAGTLSELDPERSDIYRENSARVRARIRLLDVELEKTLSLVSERGFIVFHDAWRYFDTRYGLRALGSVSVSPEQSPGAARLAEIRQSITDAEAECVFAEPQFEPRLVRALVAGTGAAVGILDPLGAQIEEGPDLYFTLMRANAATFRACFAA